MEFEGQIREIAQLSPDTLSQSVAKLTELGVKSIEDAKYIREEDLGWCFEANSCKATGSETQKQWYNNLNKT